MKKLVLMALLMVTLTNLHANEDWVSMASHSRTVFSNGRPLT